MLPIMPLMITFSCFVQLSQMATAKLVVKHSAIVGARAARKRPGIGIVGRAEDCAARQ